MGAKGTITNIRISFYGADTTEITVTGGPSNKQITLSIPGNFSQGDTAGVTLDDGNTTVLNFEASSDRDRRGMYMIGSIQLANTKKLRYSRR